jgi:hypothetical protein
MQKQTENDLQHRRIKEENQSLLNQVEKLQKALDSVPPELRGTAGEIVLFDHLHDAFPKDEFMLKKVGVKMADVIQMVVLENGEKLAPPIAWDKKTDKDKVSKDDIEKAKSYKIIHNTDLSIIVTKGITEKDSNNTLIGTREGILLVHPSIVVEICKLLRSFIIEMAKHRSNDGRASKQAKLYDHLISAEYARSIKTAKAMKASCSQVFV